MTIDLAMQHLKMIAHNWGMKKDIPLSTEEAALLLEYLEGLEDRIEDLEDRIEDLEE